MLGETQHVVAPDVYGAPSHLERCNTMDELAVILEALEDPNGSIRLPFIFSMSDGPSGRGVQAYVRTRKVGPVIIPDRRNGQTLADVLTMLADLLEQR